MDFLIYKNYKVFPSNLLLIIYSVGIDETPHRYAWEECEDVPSFIDFADNDVQGFD